MFVLAAMALKPKYDSSEYNRRNYDTFLVRVRRDSELADRIAAHKLNGESLNSLVIILLAEYFSVPIPLKWCFSRKILWSEKKPLR